MTANTAQRKSDVPVVMSISELLGFEWRDPEVWDKTLGRDMMD